MSDTPRKQCTKPGCRQWYPATTEFFSRDKNRKDGLFPQCKLCQRAYHKVHSSLPEVQEHRRAYLQVYYSLPGKREHHRAYNKSYYSLPEHREQNRVYCSFYYSQPENHRRMRIYAKVHSQLPEVQERERARGKAHRGRPEVQSKQKAYLKTYGPIYRSQPENQDRGRVYVLNRIARKKAVPGYHTVQQSREQYERQKGKCYWCGQKLTWGKHHEDHIVPLSREGSSNDISNIVVTHPHCNMSRGNKLPHEAYEFGRLL